MVRAYAKSWSDREVGEMVLIADFSHEYFYRLWISNTFSEKEVNNGTPSVFGLKRILQFKDFKDVIAVLYGKVC